MSFQCCAFLSLVFEMGLSIIHSMTLTQESGVLTVNFAFESLPWKVQDSKGEPPFLMNLPSFLPSFLVEQDKHFSDARSAFGTLLRDCEGLCCMNERTRLAVFFRLSFLCGYVLFLNRSNPSCVVLFFKCSSAHYSWRRTRRARHWYICSTRCL